MITLLPSSSSILFLFLLQHVCGMNYLLKAKSKMIDPVEDLGLEIGDGVRSVEDALNKHTKSEVI